MDGFAVTAGVRSGRIPAASLVRPLCTRALKNDAVSSLVRRRWVRTSE
jgi:hypothetical protein